MRTLYEYDARGRMTEATSADSSVAIAYNAASLPESITYDGTVSLQYEYNERGKRTSLATADGAYSVSYEYDTRQRLSAVKLVQPINKTVVEVSRNNIRVDSLHAAKPLFPCK